METIEEGFLRFMKECFLQVPQTSIQWKDSRKIFYCSAAWTVATLGECNGDTTKLKPLLNELKEFVIMEKMAKEISESIMKAGEHAKD
jgi:hypothetical protein